MAASTAASDDYGEEEYEAESPVASPALSTDAAAAPHPPAPLSAASDDGKDDDERAALVAEDRGATARTVPQLLDESFEADADEGGRYREPDPSIATRSSARRRSGRHLLDNALWTYSIEATRVRALRISIVDSADLQNLRIFASMDNQARQSRGTTWKPDAVSSRRRPSLASRSSSLREMKNSISSPGGRAGSTTSKRSGLLEEAKWAPGDGALHWSFPMEKFRQLKAYSPRIKVFLYCVDVSNVIQAEATDRVLVGAHTHHSQRHSDGQSTELVCLGWFFLDLRTPDLSSRWLKLQNAKYGGEIQIQTSLSPFASQPVTNTNTKRQAAGRDVLSKKVDVRLCEVASTRTTENPSLVQLLNHQIIIDDTGDFLQLGSRKGSDVFVVSVAINEARNLSTIVRQTLANRDQSEDVSAGYSGFWLSYSLFDVVVQTDVFHNLDAAEFPAIRDCFRVQSCIEDLRAFIEASHGGLSVYLCTNNQLIAGATIPLSDLFRGDLFSGKKEFLKAGTITSVSGRYSFLGSDSAHVLAAFSIELVNSSSPGLKRVNVLDEPEEAIKDGHSASTDNVILPTPILPIPSRQSTVFAFALAYLRLPNALLSPLIGIEGVLVHIATPEVTQINSLHFCGFEKEFTIATALQTEMKESVRTGRNSPAKVEVRIVSSITKRELASATVELSNLLTEAHASLRESFRSTHTIMIQDHEGRPAGECVIILSKGAKPSTHIDANGKENEKEDHLYRLSFQIKAVRDAINPGVYTLKFQHPFHKEIYAHSRPVTIPAKQEVNLKDAAYCISESVATPTALKRLMDQVMAIHLSAIETNFDGSSSRYEAIFSLNYLFYSQERFTCPENECRSTFETQNDVVEHYHEAHSDSNLETPTFNGCTAIKSCSIYVPVMQAGADVKQKQRVALARIDAALEDFGPTTLAPMMLVPEPASIRRKLMRGMDNQTNPSSPHQANSRLSPKIDVHRGLEAAKMSFIAQAITAPSEADTLVQSAQTDQVKQEAPSQFSEQALEWKKKIAAVERSRMDELEREWARREEERAELLRIALREYETLELKLRNALAEVETRERRLTIAEAALEREQREHRDEVDSLRRKLTSEQSYTVALASQQRDALDQRVRQLEAQLAKAEERTREVEHDYTEYRKQQRKVPEARLREEIAALRGNVAEIERQKLAEERAKHEAIDAASRLRMQLEQANKQVLEERKKHETHVVEELEKLRLKYVAREEKYVLDGDREELRAIKRQLDELRSIQDKAIVVPILSPPSVGSIQWRHKARTNQHPRSPQVWNHSQTQTRKSTGEDRIYLHGAHNSLTKADVHGTWSFQPSLDSSEIEYGHERLHYEKRRTGRSRSSGSSHSVIADFSDSENTSPRHNPVNRVSQASRVAAIAAASAASISGPSESMTVDLELKRLQNERELLLASGAYSPKSYLVRELDRLIANVRGRMRL